MDIIKNKTLLFALLLLFPLISIAQSKKENNSDYLIRPVSSLNTTELIFPTEDVQVDFHLLGLLKNLNSYSKIEITNNIVDLFSVTDISTTTQGNLSIILSGSSSPNHAIFSVGKNNDVHGVININGDEFSLKSIELSDEVVFKITKQTDIDVPDHEADYFLSTESNLMSESIILTEKDSLDGQSKINILVAYTPSARNESHAAIELYIDTLISQTNLSFLNSDIENVKVELVGVYEIEDYPLTKQGSSENLNHVRNRTDLIDLRQMYGADVVAVLLGSDDLVESCGRARINASKELAYYIARVGCQYTFTHELGHVLGMQHNIEQSQNQFYSYG